MTFRLLPKPHCEWCGEVLSCFEDQVQGAKNGEQVSYHPECIVNDMYELDSVEDPDTGIMTW